MAEQFKKDEGFQDPGMKNGRKQFGKKGYDPRHKFERKTVNLDEIETNKIEYWNKSADYSNVTKFLWDLIIGRPRTVNGTFDPFYTNNVYPTSTSTLNPTNMMAVDIVVGSGWANSTSDGVNRSLSQLMAKMRATLSTSNFGFETADLGILYASTSSIACNIGYAKKVLEACSGWKDRSYVFPRGLVKAMGFNYEEITNNWNKYTAILKALIDRYNGMNLPDIFDVYDRQYVMMHKVYADEDSDLAQLYFFRPANYYVYDDTSNPSFAKSFPINWGSVSPFTTFNAFLTIIQKQLDAWYGSSDLYQINGVVLRAFKEAPKQMIPYYELGDTLDVSVDKAHIMQIMNCTIISTLDPDSLSLTQEPNTQNFVIWEPKLDTTLDVSESSMERMVLRLFEDEPTQDDNMEMTRLTNLWYTEAGEPGRYITNCGSEIVVNINCYKYDAMADSLLTYSIGTNTHVIYLDGNASKLTQFADMLTALSPFRYIPLIQMFTQLGSDSAGYSAPRYVGMLGDQYNWAFLDINDWGQLQFVAYESLWKPKNV